MSDILVKIHRAAPYGMITLRGDLSSTALQKAATDAAGVAFPETGMCVFEGKSGLSWMSPDELLVLMPHDQIQSTLAQIEKALNSTHFLAADVSDARAMFTITGPHWRDVLAKLTPADVHPDSFQQGHFRRTRLAQVPVAFWQSSADTVTLICFRSVADYVEGLLVNAGRAKSNADYF
ncbi:sarcosine oxidase subunit gamma [Pseudaestuariivita rosea]|uniref:sarcosine oxidase subunit gamma n=1 Tax=Pseudaestuariivita rosea TaxID=2763263 RepID=UPI001ABB582D|nr:sarcosine oxidase subunit gamma family protein [Pseudaestuariivita rosea]